MSLRALVHYDPRIWQLSIMGSLLCLGVVFRDFSLQPLQILLTFVAGILTQKFFLHTRQLHARGLLSALITCFGLCLLVRSSTLWVHPILASLAISSKFLLRIHNRHVFNPANLGVILGLTLFPETWVATGQWGSDLSTALWLIAGGFWVAGNAGRLDISAYFLLFYTTLFFAIRIGWYGYPLSVMLHQLQNGALLLFAFFMISDPMTIPLHPWARILHAFIVAVLAYVWQFGLYKNQGLIWALFFASLLVPLWNVLFTGPAYQWRSS